METETIEKGLKPRENRPRPVSPINGQPIPGGRPKGRQNRITVSIKEAVEAATRPGACHPQGLTGWLIDRANGSLGDRQIFAAMVAKALPLQVQAQGAGGVVINLGWLSGRNLAAIGTVTSQSAPNLLIDNDDTRTVGQVDAVEGEIVHQADADPHPPIDRQEGGGSV